MIQALAGSPECVPLLGSSGLSDIPMDACSVLYAL